MLLPSEAGSMGAKSSKIVLRTHQHLATKRKKIQRDCSSDALFSPFWKDEPQILEKPLESAALDRKTNWKMRQWKGFKVISPVILVDLIIAAFSVHM